MTHEATLARLRELLGAESFTTSQFRDNLRVVVPPGRVLAVMECLKRECGFDMLAELTAVDYLHYPDARDRFGVVYGLLDTTTGVRLWVKTYLNEPDLAVASVFRLWRG